MSAAAPRSVLSSSRSISSSWIAAANVTSRVAGAGGGGQERMRIQSAAISQERLLSPTSLVSGGAVANGRVRFAEGKNETAETDKWSETEEADPTGPLRNEWKRRATGEPDASSYATNRRTAERNPHCISSRYTSTGGTLNKGALGTVTRVCEAKQLTCCAIAEKRQKRKATFEREVYFLHRLQPIRLDGKRIVPELFGDKTNVLNVELFKTDMLKIGKDQLERARNDSLARVPSQAKHLFKQSQVEQMFGIAQLLTNLHIIHGDLKPDNYLSTGPRAAGAEETVIVSDFGLAGDKWHPRGTGRFEPIMGWSTVMECPDGEMVSNGLLVDPLIRQYFNVWQLNEALRLSGVVVMDTADGHIHMYKPLLLPRGVSERMSRKCIQYSATECHPLEDFLGSSFSGAGL